jgi:murein L,D-transpeptidase YafK
MASAVAASALEIVLDDVAPDRVERQRRFIQGDVPLAGTPDLTKLDDRLKERDLARGRPIYVRVFKAESELELWMQNTAGTFTLLATYPICHWHGTIGPKLKEGDKQSPEGFYSVGLPQTRLVGRWRKAFNLGFPNVHDQLLSRTGSYILIHGGCSSVGCFAMTDDVQTEIYDLATAALSSGQDRFQVHVFPFRMTAENLSRHADHEWAHTWVDLKPAYDSFERTRVPPAIAVCGVRYKVADREPGDAGGAARRLPVLAPVSGSAVNGDPTRVIDDSGKRLELACAVDTATEASDSSASAIVTSATTATPTSAKAVIEPVGRREAAKKAVVPRKPKRRHVVDAPRPSPPSRRYEPRRPYSSPKVGQRKFAPGDRQETTRVGDGFGSATFRSRHRITATGG